MLPEWYPNWLIIYSTFCLSHQTTSNMQNLAENLITTRLESYNDPRPSINQSTSLKSGLTLWSVCFVLYGRMCGRTDTITRNNEPLFKLVLGRGSIRISICWFKLWVDDFALHLLSIELQSFLLFKVNEY